MVEKQHEDGSVYMPFMFQDLRDTPEKFLYFRAFFKPDTLTETFTPDWSLDKYYGRVELIPIYTGTMRIITFSFDVVCWKPDDLPIMWRKLHKLQSLVYPKFDNNGFLHSSPIIRLRVGDVFSVAAGEGTTATKKGLSGYINSIDFSYDNVWNIKDNLRTPRKVTVSLSFTALHESNPGIYMNDLKAGKGTPSFGTAITNEDGTYSGDELGIRGVLAPYPLKSSGDKVNDEGDPPPQQT